MRRNLTCICALASAAACTAEPPEPQPCRVVLAYPDVDRDGRGAGEAEEHCGAPPSGFSVVAGDCAPADRSRWQALTYAARDIDGDGHFVPEAGTVCAGERLPAGYSETAPTEVDCDDADAAAWFAYSAYRDEDGDHVGVEPRVTRCGPGPAIPPGWSETAGDCAPDDPTRAQLLPYRYRDADGDGYAVPESGEVCTGGQLPEGYLRDPVAPDCDDADPLLNVQRVAFVDADGDGHGAGQRQMICAPAQLPAGYAEDQSDCDDADPQAWVTVSYQHRDADGDGYTVAEAGVLCTDGQYPQGYLQSGSAEADCDDGEPTAFRLVQAYEDTDGDGSGVLPAQLLCTGAEVPAGFVLEAGDCAPQDAAAWIPTPYVAADRDGDGFMVPEVGELCTDDGVLPDPYRATLQGLDCDDADPQLLTLVLLFDDLDGDGVGAGPWRKECLGTSRPPGTSPYGDDVDDHDPTVQVDEDLVDLLTLEL